MGNGRIRTERASVVITHDDNAIICLKQNDTPRCLWFDSVGQLEQAISNKKLCVKRWTIAAPQSLCILKSVTLPASDLTEAGKMIEFELASLVPLPVDEVVYGCTLAAKHENTLTVTVYILRLSTLSQILEPYRSRGIEPDNIVVDSLAMQTWFESTLPDVSGTVVSAFLDTSKCIVLSSVDGRLQNVDDLLWSVDDEDHGSSKVVTEIMQRKLELSDCGDNPVALALGGLGHFTSKVRDYLHTSSDTQNTMHDQVHVAPDPTNACHPFNGHPDGSAKYLYECSIALGLHHLASHIQHPFANLMPADFLRKQQRTLRIKNYALTAGLFVFVLGLLWLSLISLNWRIARTLGLIEKEIAPVAQIAGDVESKRQLISAIEHQFSNRGTLARVIEELDRYTQNTSITIHYLRFESKSSDTLIEIKGQADDSSTVYRLPVHMQEAELLNNIGVDGTSPQPTQPGQPSRTAFKLHCDLGTGKK